MKTAMFGTNRLTNQVYPANTCRCLATPNHRINFGAYLITDNIRASKVFVIGGDSSIGASAAKYLADLGVSVTRSTRRNTELDGKQCFMDLLDDPEKWEIPRSETFLISAAICRIQDCENDPEASRKVNVESLREIINVADSQGAFILYLSTDQVFDGTVAHRHPDDRPCPKTEYGQQKAEAESIVLSASGNAAILRLTKVLDGAAGLIGSWHQNLINGKTITPFSDMVMAPILLEMVNKAISLILNSKQSGIFQLSGDIDISYAEAAHILADSIGANKNLIQPVPAREAGFSYNLPENTTLDTTRLRKQFSLQIPKSKDVIKKVVESVIIENTNNN